MSHPDGKELLWLTAEHSHTLQDGSPMWDRGREKYMAISWNRPEMLWGSLPNSGMRTPIFFWEPTSLILSHVDCWMAKRVTGKEQLYHPAIPAMLKLLSELGPAGSPDHPMAELIIQWECRHSPGGIFRPPGYSQAWSYSPVYFNSIIICLSCTFYHLQPK